MLDEKQVAVEIDSQEEDGEEVVDVGSLEFLRLQAHTWVFVELFRNEAVFGGDCEVTHGEVEQLAEDIAGVEEGVVVLVIRPVFQGHHIDDFADGVVAHVLL